MKMKNIFVVLSLSLVASMSNAAPVLYFDFDGDGLQDTSTSVALGDAVTASLYISISDADTTANGGLISWGSEINFTNSILSTNTFNLAPSWPLSGVNNGFDNASGTIDLLGSSFSAQSGTIKLADISFDTLLEGTATLSLNELFPELITFTGFASSNGHDYDAEIDYSLASANVNVSAVPVPSALILFVSGLVGLLRLSQRKV